MKNNIVIISSIILLTSMIISGCINNSDEDKSESPLPEEVQLFFNHTCFFSTGLSKFLEVGGEPEGSNITWTLNGEVIGYGKTVYFMPRKSEYALLRADVSWGEYQKNHSRWIRIPQTDNRGSFETSSNGLLESEAGPTGYAFQIVPAITIPSLMLNVSATQINGSLKYWIKLQEKNKIESFETVAEVEADLNGGNYSRSFFLSKMFFMDREDYEPYYLSFLFMIESLDGSFSQITTEHWLDY